MLFILGRMCLFYLTMTSSSYTVLFRAVKEENALIQFVWESVWLQLTRVWPCLCLPIDRTVLRASCWRCSSPSKPMTSRRRCSRWTRTGWTCSWSTSTRALRAPLTTAVLCCCSGMRRWVCGDSSCHSAQALSPFLSGETQVPHSGCEKGMALELTAELYLLPTAASLGKHPTVKIWVSLRLRQTKCFHPLVQVGWRSISFLEGSKICTLVMQGNESLSKVK